MDRGYVDRLAGHLRSRGITVWYDYEIETGDTFSMRIQSAIDACAAFLVVLSPASVNSAWVRREIARATRARKSMHPLLRRPCDVPLELDGVQHEDVTHGQMPTDRFIDMLARVTQAPARIPPAPIRRARTWGILAPFVVVVAAMVLLGPWWFISHRSSVEPRAESSTYGSGTSTVPARPTRSGVTTTPPQETTPPPKRLSSVSRATPGCQENDPRVIWTLVKGDVSCSSGATTLTKRVGWDNSFLQSYAELRMSLRNQKFPVSYTVSFTIGGLSGPELDANHGGCGGLAVHTTSDGRTYDYFNVCADGWIEAVRVVDAAGVENRTREITPGPRQGSSPTYDVTVNVTGASVQVRVSNGVGQSETVSLATVRQTTSYISLITTWRNVGATASFSDLTYSASA